MCDRDQLVGRIQRPPQAKVVHIYDIFAAGTRDLFLSELSYGKAAVMDAFIGATASAGTSCIELSLLFHRR